ncbi:MAG: hypothetical protein H0U74_05870 [Bradymonadaceae bacterium]|nr:hypothetical protein [Lujinxingiaceae bacterium]
MTRKALIFLAVLVAFSLACAWFDDDVTNVTYQESVEVQFLIDAELLCPPAEDCTVPPTPTNQEVALTPIEFDVKVDIVEATGNEDLAGAAGQFRSIEITSIDYHYTQNTLNLDLPPLKIYVGPLNATKHNGTGVVELTTIPAVQAGKSDRGTAPAVAANVEAISEHFKTLKFAAIPYAAVVIPEGQPFPPIGAANLKLTLNLKLVANPADAL